MAAAQLRYDLAKSTWLEAIKQAQSEKDKARATYDDEKANGDTDASSFAQWVYNGNGIVFNQVYAKLQEAEVNYFAAFRALDSSAAEEWHEKQRKKLAPLRVSRDSDEREFIIYTGEE